MTVGPDTTATSAIGINNSGEIVGSYGDPGGTSYGFLYAGGNFGPVNVPSATYAEALGVNDIGDIVGFYGDAMRTYHGFLYTKGSVTPLDAPGATGTYAHGINHSGNIVGFYVDAQGATHGFLSNGGLLTPMDVPGAAHTEALGIDNSGDIVGYYVDAKGVSHGFLYAKGSFTPIDFPGAAETWASGINASGNIVGYYVDAIRVTHGFVATFFNTTLTLLKSGTGNGTVTSNPAGIDCGFDCNGCYDHGTAITLSAIPDAGSVFTGWSGPCSGTGSCTVTMAADEVVRALFTASTPVQYTLTVLKSGTGTVTGTGTGTGTEAWTGTGTVTSSPPGINCGNDCSETYSTAQKVQLTAKADADSIFAGWAGGCSGTGSCQVTVSGAETVIAKFTLNIPKIKVPPTSIQFGATKVGKQATKTLKITNDGSADLLVTVAGLEGTEFSVQGSSSVTIKAKKSYQCEGCICA